MSNKELLHALKSARGDVAKGAVLDVRSKDRPEELKASPTKSKSLAGKKKPKAAKASGRKKSKSVLPQPVLAKLEKFCGKHWSPERIMERMVEGLPFACPAIVIEGKVLVPSDVFRVLSREGDVLTISNGKKSYVIRPLKSKLYYSWKSYFSAKSDRDPAKSAMEMCIYELEAYLNNFEDFAENDWTKDICSGDYELLA